MIFPDEKKRKFHKPISKRTNNLQTAESAEILLPLKRPKIKL